MAEKPIRPVAIIILDGLGIREMKEANAVALAETPNYDRWNMLHERCVLDASGLAVGPDHRRLVAHGVHGHPRLRLRGLRAGPARLAPRPVGAPRLVTGPVPRPAVGPIRSADAQASNETRAQMVATIPMPAITSDRVTGACSRSPSLRLARSGGLTTAATFPARRAPPMASTNHTMRSSPRNGVNDSSASTSPSTDTVDQATEVGRTLKTAPAVPMTKG